MPKEFNETEIKVLNMLMEIAETIIGTQNGFMDINYDVFNSNDLYNLKVKLGLEE